MTACKSIKEMEKVDKVNETLAMIHVGIIVKHFLDDEMLPDTLDDVTAILYKELGVEVKRGDNLQDLRNRIIAAYIDKFDSEGENAMDAFNRAMKGV